MVSFKGEGVTGDAGTQWSYEANAQIGDPGGFGQVFRGTGPGGRAVAVKRVRLQGDGEGARRRREREVEISRILGAIPTEHLMHLLDIGHDGEDLLLVMPLADRSLAAAIRGPGLDDANQIEVLRQVAQGLFELAQASVLHRDLKPANVLDVGGLWRLADFGISRALLAPTATYTFSGFGTMEYMAPELWRGQPATVKTDLYAFGVLAYEVLTGERPFRGVNEETLMRQHQEEAPPSLPDRIPVTVRHLVLRLLAKDPTQRPQDARTVVEWLDAARRPPAGEQLRRLQEAAYSAAELQSRDGGAHAALAAEQAMRARQNVQAITDLHYLLQTAANQAREALPDLEFRHNLIGRFAPPGEEPPHGVKMIKEFFTRTRGWQLLLGSAKLSVQPWWTMMSLSPTPGDPLLLAGAVYTDRVVRSASTPIANIV